ncbi:hypothetical protein DERP_009024 [Dermatophagoides pteronyssinus]|uniref:Uncharacterized protein n=1 Tax=Dermatophagoides pteronyssinus TaxID=6956 RepID=A0ABQ8JG86_DERPT|nr:hypothetical protein DERP_009024 [Dermatophagoides pteronyssinus]
MSICINHMTITNSSANDRFSWLFETIAAAAVDDDIIVDRGRRITTAGRGFLFDLVVVVGVDPFAVFFALPLKFDEDVDVVNVFGGGVGFELLLLLLATFADLFIAVVGVDDDPTLLSEALPLTNDADIGTRFLEFDSKIKI